MGIETGKTPPQSTPEVLLNEFVRMQFKVDGDVRTMPNSSIEIDIVKRPNEFVRGAAENIAQRYGFNVTFQSLDRSGIETIIFTPKNN